MKTFYNLLHTEKNHIDIENIFHFKVNEDVRRFFLAIKSLVVDIVLFAIGFIAIIWIFGVLPRF